MRIDNTANLCRPFHRPLSAVDGRPFGGLALNSIALVAFDVVAFGGVAPDGVSLSSSAFGGFAFDGFAFDAVAFDVVAFDGVAFNSLALGRRCGIRWRCVRRRLRSTARVHHHGRSTQDKKTVVSMAM